MRECSTIAALFCVAGVELASASAAPPSLGPEVPGTSPDRAVVLSAILEARLQLVGLRLHTRTDEFVEGVDGVYRSWDEQLIVGASSARVENRYLMSETATGSGPLHNTEIFAKDSNGALHWGSDSRQAVLVANAGSLPRCSVNYCFFACWFPVAYNEPNTAPVDLADMVLDPSMTFAPLTQSVDGADCLVLRSASPGGLVVSVWIDPARSMFPRLQRVEKPEGLICEWHTTEFSEVAASVWVPSAGEYWHQGIASSAGASHFPVLRTMQTVPSGSSSGAELVADPGDLMTVPASSSVEDAATGETWFVGRTSYAETGRMALAALRGEPVAGGDKPESQRWRSPSQILVAVFGSLIPGSVLGLAIGARRRGAR